MESAVNARGHPNVSATHKMTIEITKGGFLTPTGDCIIGIASDKACADLDARLKNALLKGKKLIITLECNGLKDEVVAYGDPRLTLTNPVSMVIRKSSFICGRTLCVRADKAAADLNRSLVEELRKGGKLLIALEIS